ncbi:MAG: ABC transporter ATP-binding protein [Firmicutes bacterium]|nr:ABC transporter ATP-binding protein [Bacillota bacterium]
MAPALIVENLFKYFPPAQSGWRAMLQPLARATCRALAGVSFTVSEGTAMAIVGPNGAGKSTLLRILATLLLPTRGCARVAGFDVVRCPAEVRCRIGVHSGTDGGFYARLTARENLRFFATLNNLHTAETRARIAELAEWLHLGPILDCQVRTLSTGTVHRLNLARALLHHPSVLLLDEPTRSLDPLAAASFRRLLREELIGRRGITVLFSSHALEEVHALADRILLLDSGRVRACATPDELLRRTATDTLEAALARLLPSPEPQP